MHGLIYRPKLVTRVIFEFYDAPLLTCLHCHFLRSKGENIQYWRNHIDSRFLMNFFAAQTSLGSLERALIGLYFVTPLFAFLPP
jgi:hypothetical protein